MNLKALSKQLTFSDVEPPDPELLAESEPIAEDCDYGYSEWADERAEADALDDWLDTEDRPVEPPSPSEDVEGRPVGRDESGEPERSIDDEGQPLGSTPSLPPLQVRVTRSPRRRKTAEARLVGHTLEIRIPDRCDQAEEQHFVEYFSEKFERSRMASLVDLEDRARELAATYDLPVPELIRWVSNQRQQWGSCTPADRSIRLSDRMAGFPGWVIDYVIVHELAHLVVLEHSPEFWQLVYAYPLTERARGYLLAKDGV